MGALSRFNEIAANQEKAREEQTDREKEKVTSTDTGNTTEERPSALDKLRKYEQQAKEGRTEQLQSEKNQEQQQQTIRRNRLRR